MHTKSNFMREKPATPTSLSCNESVFICRQKSCRRIFKFKKTSGTTLLSRHLSTTPGHQNCARLYEHLHSKRQLDTKVSFGEEEIGQARLQVQPSLQTITSLFASQKPAQKPKPFTTRLFQFKLLRFVVETDQPYNIVEHPAFQDLVQCLISCPKAERSRALLISRSTMARHVKQGSVTIRTDIAEILQSVPAGFSICLDAWTSANGYAFLAITAHWLDEDWNLIELLIDFIELEVCDIFNQYFHLSCT